MHIEDQVSGAIHAYANLLGGAPQVQLELRAMADHMGAFLVEQLGLKQEWAVGTFCQGKLDDIDDEDTTRQDVAGALAMHERLDALEVCPTLIAGAGIRRTVMTRLYTDWAEDAEPTLDEDLAALVEADGDACPTPDACDWNADGADWRCASCDKVEPQSEVVVRSE